MQIVKLIVPFVVTMFLLGCGGGSSKSSSETPPSTAPLFSMTGVPIAENVAVGATQAVSFSVSNVGDATLTFTATTATPWITGLPAGTQSVAAGASTNVPLTVDCPQGDGANQRVGAVSLATNATSTPNATVDVTVNCFDPAIQIQIVTPAATAIVGAVGTTVSDQFSFRYAGGDPGSMLSWMMVDNLSAAATAFAPASGQLAPDTTVAVDVSYTCPAAPAILNAALSLELESQVPFAVAGVAITCEDNGNAAFSVGEFFQGPLAGGLDSGDTVTQVVDVVVNRQIQLNFSVTHGTNETPEIDLVFRQSGSPLETQRHSAVNVVPPAGANDPWTSVYSVNIRGDLVQRDVMLQGVIDPDNAIAETDESDNQFNLVFGDLNTDVIPEFLPVFVPITAEGRTPASIDTAAYLQATLDLFPVGEYSSSIGAGYTYQGGAWDWGTALTEMFTLWNSNAQAGEFFHGIYRQPNSFMGGTNGIAFIGLPVAVTASLDSPGGNDETVAHEFGHNFGLQHAPGGCGESETDQNYPYAFAAIGPNDGWLLSQQLPIGSEDGYFDIMSYCTPYFISDYNFSNVVDAMSVSSLPSIASTTGSGDGSLALTGRVDELGGWRLTHVAASSQSARAATGGPYVLVLYGDDSLEIYREKLRVYGTDHGALRAWAVRVPNPSVPAAAVRIFDEDGNLLLDEDL